MNGSGPRVEVLHISQGRLELGFSPVVGVCRGGGLLRGTTFYTLAESGQGEESSRRALAVATRALERATGTITGAMTAALSQAFKEFDPPDRSALACAALRGNRLYLGFLGEGLGHLTTEEGVEQLWGVAIGEDPLQPRLDRLELAPGDLVAVASPLLARLVPEAGLVSLFQGSLREIAQKLLKLFGDATSFTVLLIYQPGTVSEGP